MSFKNIKDYYEEMEKNLKDSRLLKEQFENAVNDNKLCGISVLFKECFDENNRLKDTKDIVSQLTKNKNFLNTAFDIAEMNSKKLINETLVEAVERCKPPFLKIVEEYQRQQSLQGILRNPSQYQYQGLDRSTYSKLPTINKVPIPISNIQKDIADIKKDLAEIKSMSKKDTD